MDEVREPLLMLSVAVAVAVYKALLFVQGSEAQNRADCVATRKRNVELHIVVKQQAGRIKELEEIYLTDQADKEHEASSIWDNDDHPW